MRNGTAKVVIAGFLVPSDITGLQYKDMDIKLKPEYFVVLTGCCENCWKRTTWNAGIP